MSMLKRTLPASTRLRIELNAVAHRDRNTDPGSNRKTEEKLETIPYTSATTDDSTLDVGATALVTQGVNGERVITYEVVYEDGVEVSRSVKSEAVRVQPVQEITAVGTRQPAPPPPSARSRSCW